ncbi:MAG: MiaB/RimO family radical SAM methylthiotransferase, partial [Acidobacteriota bacterium]|nr:MiaB/RimO family radical SAM methylthiotransferase [Acidobacteriota bacterium]
HRSDKQARQAVRRVHRENPAARIVVSGCYAQRDAAAAAELPGVCLVAGNAEKIRIPDLLKTAEKFPDKKIFRSDNLITIETAEISDDIAPEKILSPIAGDRTRPLVKLQDGCDNRCAYCVVPSVRGPGHSVPPENVLRKIRSLTDLGFREIVLTGINLGAYGRRIKDHARLTDILRRIVALPGIGRIRLSSVEPVFFDREIVRLAGENAALARHFHIPLQSGSDRILRLMRRPYTTARFRELVEFIHGELPDAGLGTDIITGFPGETDRDFEETRRFIEEMPFSYLHVFPFSPREGTEAFSLPGRVPSHTAKQRAAEIIRLGSAKNLEFRRRFLGRPLSAITLSKEEAEGEPVVLTHNFIHARLSGLAVPPNRLLDIRIEEVRAGSTRAAVLI